MATAEAQNLNQMVQANDKLLKALVTLLALKDEHLLEEMQIVFAAALQNNSVIAKADQPTWAHIRMELRMIGDLVADIEPTPLPKLAVAGEIH